MTLAYRTASRATGKKEHICGYCRMPIRAGERYAYDFELRVRWHQACALELMHIAQQAMKDTPRG